MKNKKQKKQTMTDEEMKLAQDKDMAEIDALNRLQQDLEKSTEEQLTNLAKSIIYIAIIGHIVLFIKSSTWLNYVVTGLPILLLFGLENKIKSVRKQANDRTKQKN